MRHSPDSLSQCDAGGLCVSHINKTIIKIILLPSLKKDTGTGMSHFHFSDYHIYPFLSDTEKETSECLDAAK